MNNENTISKIKQKIQQRAEQLKQKINNLKQDIKQFKLKINQLCISHASDARHVLLVLVMLSLNFYFALTGFLEEKNIFTTVSEVIMQYSWIVFILLFGALLYFDTYINRHTSRKISFGIAGTYLAIFAEARFVIKQEFDLCFSIMLMALVALPKIQDLVGTKKKTNNNDNDSPNSYSPVTKESNLFKSRKSQQDYLISLFQNDSLVNKGMSICIKGKWGSGKTSFINTTLDRMKNGDTEFEEIRINALELEETSALIKYYFTRIKKILEKKDAYVGIKSEYRSLVNSLLKSATSENLSEFIMNAFEEDEDYRSMISEISEVIQDVLCNSIIVIIVDDIERCSDNKIKQLIFFVKEIATMNRCISLFLVDDFELFKNSGLGDDTSTAAEFVDKFFDEVISLRNVSISESIERFKDTIFENHINSLIEYFEKRIEKVNNETVSGTNQSQKLEEKKNRIAEIQEKEQKMKIMFSNPRRLKKIYSFYDRYCSAINNLIESIDNDSTKKVELTQFLNNIEHTKQILFISIIQDSFNEHYNQIANDKIDSVIKYLPHECWLKGIIIEEWFPLISNFFTSKKLSFSDAIIHNDYDAILNMVNPFSNIYDEYKNSIIQGIIPQKNGTDISILDCFEVLHKSNGYDSDLMKKMFDVYKQKTSFDEALTVFYSNSVAHARDIAIVEFADICCTSTYTIDNIDTCRERFERIYPKVLWKLLIDFKAFFCHHDLRLERDVEEVVFNNPSFSDSINQYVTKISSKFNFELSSSEPVDKLSEILEKMSEYYRSRRYPVQATDFQNLLKYSQTALKRIKALSRIEEYINSSHNTSTSVNNTLMQEITNIRNIIKQQKENNDKFLNYDGFRDFMKKIESNGLSPDEMAEFKIMIEELSDIDLSYSIWARQLYFELESQAEIVEEE